MDINKYTIQDPILAQAWDALINGGAYTIVNNEIVVRADAAKRIYAAICAYYNMREVNKDFLTKKDFEQMYIRKADVSLPDSIHESRQAKPKVNITIKWKHAISVEDFDTDQLNSKEEETADLKKVVYVFIGYNTKGEMGVDVGQTGRTLKIRTTEHLADKDFLEGYPHDQVVFCGDVTCEKTIDRAMLEQIEGILIQYLNCHKGDKYHLCNNSKLNTFKSTYSIGHINNENMLSELVHLIAKYIPVED